MAQQISIRNNGRKQKDKRGNFRPDKVQIDDVLEENGLRYDHWDLMEDEIDWQASLENRGRLETALNPAIATRYQVVMEGGQALPEPVAAQQPNGLYRLLGGVHTATGARQSKVNIFRVYRVHVTAENRELVFEFLPKFLNMKGGQALNELESMQSAVWAVSKGRPVETAAGWFGVKPNALKDELRRLKLIATLRDGDVRGLEYFDKRKSTAMALGQLDDNLPVLIAAADVVIQGMLTQEQTLAFVHQVKEQKRETDMLQVVAQWHEDHVENRPEKVITKKSNYSVSLGWTKSVRSYLVKVTCLSQIRGGEDVSPEDQWRDAQLYGEVGEMMRRICARQRIIAVQQGLIKPEPEPEPDLPEPEMEPLPRR